MSRGSEYGDVEDVHADLRARLIARLAAGGDAEVLARQCGLVPDTVLAFTQGARLATWAASALARLLDQLDGAMAEREADE